MKFTATLKDLNVAANQAAVTIGGAAANLQEVLRNYLLQVENGTFLLIGSDLEISMISRKPAEVEVAGRTLIDAKKFNDILRYASGEMLSFSLENDKLILATATSKWTLLARPVDDYPLIEDFDKEAQFLTLNRMSFMASIARVQHSICEDEVRKNLTALAISKNKILAANGKMASSYDLTDITAPGALPMEAYLPARSISPLVRVLSSFEETTFDFQDAKAFYYFRIGNNIFNIRKSTINFPVDQTNKLLKSHEANPLELTVNRQALIGAIERVRLNSSEESRAIFMEAGQSRIELKSKDEVGNNAMESVACQRPNETSQTVIAVYFNWLNLLESIKSMVSDQIKIKFGTDFHKTPLFLGETNYKSIVLPIQEAFKADDIK